MAAAHAETLVCCIPTYRCRSSLPRALDSVLAQTRRPDDIYVIDDAGGDVDDALIASYPTVTFLRNRVNRGPYFAVNHVLANTTSDYVAFQDADDWSLPHRLEAQLHLLRERRADGCGTSWLAYDPRRSACAKVRPPAHATPAVLRARHRKLLHPSTVYRRRVFDDLVGFDSRKTFGADKEFQFRAALHGLALVNVQTVSYVYTKRPGSLTQSPETGKGSPRRRQYEDALLRALRLTRLGARPKPEQGQLLDGGSVPRGSHADGADVLWLPAGNRTWQR